MSKTIEAEIGEIKIPIVVNDIKKFINFVRKGDEDSTKGICNFKDAEKKCYLGKGTFGVVSRLCCLEDEDKEIAVKIIDTTGKTQAAIAEVEKEKDVNTALFKGPKKGTKEGKDNIVQYYGSIDANKILGIENKLLMFFEICNFGDLREMTNIKFAVKDENFKDCCLQICKGLQFIHNCEYYHGDLALRNILVSGNDTKRIYKIADFGLSKLMNPSVFIQCPTDKLPPELPPDQCFNRKGKCDGRKLDTFTLGIIYLQLLLVKIDILRYPNKDLKGKMPTVWFRSNWITRAGLTEYGRLIKKDPEEVTGWILNNSLNDNEIRGLTPLEKIIENPIFKSRDNLQRVMKIPEHMTITLQRVMESSKRMTMINPKYRPNLSEVIKDLNGSTLPGASASGTSSISAASAASSISAASLASRTSSTPAASMASGTSISDALRKRNKIIRLTEEVKVSPSTIKGGNRKKKKSKKGNKKKRKINRK